MTNRRLHTHLVAPDELDLRLRRLHQPSENALEAMARSLRKHGQLSPLAAVDEDGGLILVDGFKRQGAAEKIGLERLSVMPVAAQSAQSKALMYLLNRSRGFTNIQEALLVRELVEVDGLQQVEAALILERHKSWVCRRLSMIRALAPEIVDDLQLGLLPPGCGCTLARLPRCNQADLAVAIRTHRLAPAQIRRIVDIWCKTREADFKKFLLMHPLAALNCDKGDSKRWCKALDALRRIARKVQCEFEKNTITPSAPMQKLLTEAQNACEAALGAISKLLKEPP